VEDLLIDGAKSAKFFSSLTHTAPLLSMPSAKGKKAKVALVAVMRKLLAILNSIAFR
jgi:hypothetical protein